MGPQGPLGTPDCLTPCSGCREEQVEGAGGEWTELSRCQQLQLDPPTPPPQHTGPKAHSDRPQNQLSGLSLTIWPESCHTEATRRVQ